MKEYFKEFLESEFVQEYCRKDEKNQSLISQMQNNMESLKETNKINFFNDLINNNPHLFYKKTVLNLNPCFGLFALFVARAGASKVYAVIKCTSHRILLQKIIDMNNFSETIILVTNQGEIELPEKIDTIIADWAGSFMINDGILKDLIFCRDRYLKDGGSILPDIGRFYIAGVDDKEYYSERFSFWKNVYSYKMTIMSNLYYREACLDLLKKNHIISNSMNFKNINLNSISYQDIEFISSYKIESLNSGELNALTIWFDLDFSKGHVNRSLSSSPLLNKDNYSHAIFYLEKPIKINKGNVIKGNLAIKLDDDVKGRVDLRISYHYEKSNFSHDQFFTVDN